MSRGHTIFGDISCDTSCDTLLFFDCQIAFFRFRFRQDKKTKNHVNTLFSRKYVVSGFMRLTGLEHAVNGFQVLRISVPGRVKQQAKLLVLEDVLGDGGGFVIYIISDRMFIGIIICEIGG